MSVFPSTSTKAFTSFEITLGNIPKVSIIFCKTSSVPPLTDALLFFYESQAWKLGNKPPKAGVCVVKII